MRVAHLAVKLGLGHQCGHGVNDQHIDRAGANQRFGDFKSLLAAVGLRNKQVVDVDAQFFRVARIKRMLGVDKGCQSAGALRFGNDLQRDGGFCLKIPVRRSPLHGRAGRRPLPVPGQS